MRAGGGFWRKSSISPDAAPAPKSTPCEDASSGEEGMPTTSTSASGKSGAAEAARTSVSPHATARQ